MSDVVQERTIKNIVGDILKPQKIRCVQHDKGGCRLCENRLSANKNSFKRPSKNINKRNKHWSQEEIALLKKCVDEHGFDC